MCQRRAITKVVTHAHWANRRLSKLQVIGLGFSCYPMFDGVDDQLRFARDDEQVEDEAVSENQMRQR